MLLLSLPASLPTAPTRSSLVGVSSVGASSVGVPPVGVSVLAAASIIVSTAAGFGVALPFSSSTTGGFVITPIPFLIAFACVPTSAFLKCLSYPFFARIPPAPRSTAPAKPPVAKPNVMVPATIAAFVPIFLSISILASGLAFTNALPVLRAFFAKYPVASTAAPANNPPVASAMPVPSPSASFAAKLAIPAPLPLPIKILPAPLNKFLNQLPFFLPPSSVVSPVSSDVSSASSDASSLSSESSDGCSSGFGTSPFSIASSINSSATVSFETSSPSSFVFVGFLLITPMFASTAAATVSVVGLVYNKSLAASSDSANAFKSSSLAWSILNLSSPFSSFSSLPDALTCLLLQLTNLRAILLLSLPASLPTAPTRPPSSPPSSDVSPPVSSDVSSESSDVSSVAAACSSASSISLTILLFSTVSPFSSVTVSGLVIEDIPCLIASPSVSCEGFLKCLS